MSQGTRNWLIGGTIALVGIFLLIGWANSPSAADREAQRLFGDGPVGPHTKKALELAAAVRDRHQAADVTNAAIAGQVPCGVAALNAFDASTGKPRYFAYRWPDGSLECFTTGGFHRITRQPLVGLGTDEVRSILGDPQRYPREADGLWGPIAHIQTAPRPAVSRPPAPVATPVPELGEGPCCKQ